MSDTRQRALDAALELFSRRSYDAVSMNDIAGILGIKAPSLYKYFKGKGDIYAALGPVLEDHYSFLWKNVEYTLERLEAQADRQGHITPEQLEQSMAWFGAELADAKAQSCRMLVGRYRWLWKEPLGLYEGFFERLIAKEVLRRGDPHVMAVQYLAPLLQLLALWDASGEPGAEALMEEAKLHIRQFHRVFARPEQRPGTPGAGVGRLFRR